MMLLLWLYLLGVQGLPENRSERRKLACGRRAGTGVYERYMRIPGTDRAQDSERSRFAGRAYSQRP